MLHRLLFSLLILLSSTVSFGQEVVATDGNFASTAQGSLSWTLGEVVTETFSTVDSYFTQGFQQNYEEILSLDEFGPEGQLTVFPNPFLNELNIQLSDASPDYTLTILDYQSKVVFQREIYLTPGAEQLTLDLSELSRGYYFLHLTMTHSDEHIVQPIVKTH